MSLTDTEPAPAPQSVIEARYDRSAVAWEAIVRLLARRSAEVEAGLATVVEAAETALLTEARKRAGTQR